MKRKIIITVVSVAILVTGIVVGRVTTPTKERIVEKEVEKIVEVESKTSGLAKEYLLKFIDVREKVAALPTYEEQYQTTMGMKFLASEEYKMWDDLLNDIYAKLKETLSPEEMDKLTELQVQWIKHRDETAEADGKEYEGGTMQGLIVISSKGYTTKERCLELIRTYME